MRPAAPASACRSSAPSRIPSTATAAPKTSPAASRSGSPCPMNCRKTNVLPTSCVCGGMRSSRPTGAVQKEFAQPRERRGEGTPPYGSSPERICPTDGTAGCRDVTPSIRSKSENRGTRPRFSGICKANSIKYVCEAHEKRHAKGVPFAFLRTCARKRYPLPYSGCAGTGRAGAPQCAA